MIFTTFQRTFIISVRRLNCKHTRFFTRLNIMASSTTKGPVDTAPSVSALAPEQGPGSASPASTSSQQALRSGQKPKPKTNTNKSKQSNAGRDPKPNQMRSAKLRGMDKDPMEVRVSKTLSWLLRHGAQSEGLPMRKDGYVKVLDLLEHPKLKAHGLDLENIKTIVKDDKKQRYDLILEDRQGLKLASFPPAETTLASEEQPAPGASSPTENHAQDGIWWIKARQGHSIKTVQIELKPITAVADIPTGIAVHGTNKAAWDAISKSGLSKMKRNHIHLAQNVAGDGVISGMRSSSKVLIYIDVEKALESGIKFWLSDNGVVLTEGDEKGFLPKSFFKRVADANGTEITDWMKT